MATYTGTPYPSGPLPGPPRAPPPVRSRQPSYQQQDSTPRYVAGAPNGHQGPPYPTTDPGYAPQNPQFPPAPQPSQHQPIPRPQYRNIANSGPQFQPGSCPQGSQIQYPPHWNMYGSTPPQQYGSSYPSHGGAYAFGEPDYAPRPGMDPRRMSMPGSAPYGGPQLRQGYRGRSYDEDMAFDSLYGSDDDGSGDDDEERRRRRKERHRRRREAEAAAGHQHHHHHHHNANKEPPRPTIGGSMFSLFDELKGAIGGGKDKDTT